MFSPGKPGLNERITYPPWMDPHYMLMASSYTFRHQITTGVAGTLIAQGDPTRWAIGFVATGHGTFSGAVTTVTASYVRSLINPSATQLWWFNIFTHGPLVMDGWITNGTTPEDIGIIEVTITW